MLEVTNIKAGKRQENKQQQKKKMPYVAPRSLSLQFHKGGKPTGQPSSARSPQCPPSRITSTASSSRTLLGHNLSLPSFTEEGLASTFDTPSSQRGYHVDLATDRD